MRRGDAARDMQANLVSGRLRGDPQALQRLIRRIPPLLPYRSLIRTSLDPLISIICHISLPVHSASHVEVLSQSFRKAKKTVQGTENKLFLTHDVMESRRRHWVTDC
jgi:hypothetical protein